MIYSQKLRRPLNELDSVAGHVTTPDGVVVVWEHDSHVRLEMALRERVYWQEIAGRYSQRYLVTLANRFALAVAMLADSEVSRR